MNERHELAKASTYVNFRLTTQEALLCFNDENESSIVLSVIRCVRSLSGPSFEESLSSILPNLIILRRIYNNDLQDALQTLISRVQRGVKAESLKPVKIQYPPRTIEPDLLSGNTNQLVDSVKDLSLKKLGQVPLHRLERWLRLVSAKLNHDWRLREDSDSEVSEDGSSGHKNGRLILEMLDLLKF